MPGPGMCAQAMKRNAFARVLKHPVDKEIYSLVEELCGSQKGEDAGQN